MIYELTSVGVSAFMSAAMLGRIWVSRRQRPKDAGPATGLNVELLKQEFANTDMDTDEFERRLDRLLSGRDIAYSLLDDMAVVRASADVCCQPSAGVVPGNLTVSEYADQLRFAGSAYPGAYLPLPLEEWS